MRNRRALYINIQPMWTSTLVRLCRVRGAGSQRRLLTAWNWQVMVSSKKYAKMSIKLTDCNTIRVFSTVMLTVSTRCWPAVTCVNKNIGYRVGLIQCPNYCSTERASGLYERKLKSNISFRYFVDSLSPTLRIKYYSLLQGAGSKVTHIRVRIIL